MRRAEAEYLIYTMELRDQSIRRTLESAQSVEDCAQALSPLLKEWNAQKEMLRLKRGSDRPNPGDSIVPKIMAVLDKINEIQFRDAAHARAFIEYKLVGERLTLDIYNGRSYDLLSATLRSIFYRAIELKMGGNNCLGWMNKKGIPLEVIDTNLKRKRIVVGITSRFVPGLGVEPLEQMRVEYEDGRDTQAADTPAKVMFTHTGRILLKIPMCKQPSSVVNRDCVWVPTEYAA